MNTQFLETKNQLSVVEQSLKEKEERLASNDKGIFIDYQYIVEYTGTTRNIPRRGSKTYVVQSVNINNYVNNKCILTF